MFLYFVPGKPTIGRDELADLGLAYVLDKGLHFHACGVSGAGPSGGTGCVFAVSRGEDLAAVGASAGRCNVKLSDQVWRQIPGRDVWVGYWKDALPGPEDLARREQLAGHWLELLDGRRWRVPMARGWSESDGDEMRWRILLPQRLDIAADGRWVNGPIVERFAPLWEICEAWLTARCGGQTDRFDNQGDIDAAILCLQANYRIGRVEAALLGILKEESIEPILDCLIDWAGWLAYLKKKAEQTTGTEQAPPAAPSETSLPNASPARPPAGASSSAGPADEIPATGPPVPTSPP